MNPNRQNNRLVTPVGPGYGRRPGGRPAGTPVNSVCVTPATVTGCAGGVGVVGVASDCCEPCCDPCCDPCCESGNNSGIIGGIIIGQGNAGCNKETMLNGMPIAMAYVPWQSYGNVYNLQTALQRGTLFQELDLDFAGRRCN